MKQILLCLLLVAVALSCGGECQCGCNSGAGCSCQRPSRPNLACHDRGLPRVFTLSLQYAARKSVAFNSNQGRIYWNNVFVGTLAPNDYNIHTFSAKLRVNAGSNVLRIEGAGVSNSYGLTIDNVQLVREGTCQNIVVNGGFETPAQNKNWHIYPGVLGWASNEIQIGWGKIYNSAWTSQVCQLDGNRNDVISQTFNFNQRYELVRSC